MRIVLTFSAALSILTSAKYNCIIYRKDQRGGCKLNILRYGCGSDANKLRAEFASFGNKTVVALGFFDGMHKAHRELFRIARAEADRIGCPLAVFTFSGKSA